MEGAVVTEALEAIANGTPRRRTYGYSDTEAFAVGLTCGGTVHVLIDPAVSPVYDELRRAVAAGEPVAVATVSQVRDRPEPDGSDDASGAVAAAEQMVPEVAVDGDGLALGASILVHADGRVEGSLGSPDLDRALTRDTAGALASGLSATRHYGCRWDAHNKDVEVFIEVFAAPPRLIIFGAMDFTAALVKLGKLLGYHVTVCDARPVFATRARFAQADEVVAQRPERFLKEIGPSLTGRDAICVLTHDPKFDVPAIMAALDTEVGYLGAMGSRKTNADRAARLAEVGADAAALERRLMAPIGLDIGARTPEETAVAIMAEVIALRAGRVAASLRDTTGPIHTSAPVPAAG